MAIVGAWRIHEDKVHIMKLIEVKKLLAFKPFVMPIDAAIILNVSKQRIEQLIKDGKLESFDFLGTKRVVSASILRRIEERVCIPKKRLQSLL